MNEEQQEALQDNIQITPTKSAGLAAKAKKEHNRLSAITIKLAKRLKKINQKIGPNRKIGKRRKMDNPD